MASFIKVLLVILPVIVAYCLLTRVKFDPESIRGKHVLVTGASSGIGESVAYKYAELGAKIVITARRKELLEKVAKKCQHLGAQSVHLVPADMALPSDRKNVVAATKKHLGGLDFLILNHAIMHYSPWKFTPEDFSYSEYLMNVNFHSFVELTSMLMEDLKLSKGRIGVVSSVAGKVGTRNMAAYSANKHAMQGFYASLRQELRAKKTDVSITLIVYGPVASNKALEILNTSSSSIEMEKYAGTTDDAADILVKGVSAGEYEVYFPIFATFGVYLSRLFPFFAEDLFNYLVDL